MKNELNKRHNELTEFDTLPVSFYENIFNVYREDNEFYAYNILKSVHIPTDIDEDYIMYIRVTGKQTWVNISYSVYNTIQLWWLICVTNGIHNPVINPRPSTLLKVIKPEYVQSVLDRVKLK